MSGSGSRTIDNFTLYVKDGRVSLGSSCGPGGDTPLPGGCPLASEHTGQEFEDAGLTDVERRALLTTLADAKAAVQRAAGILSALRSGGGGELRLAARTKAEITNAMVAAHAAMLNVYEQM